MFDRWRQTANDSTLPDAKKRSSFVVSRWSNVPYATEPRKPVPYRYFDATGAAR